MGTPRDAALEVLAERVECPEYVVMSMPALPIRVTSHLIYLLPGEVFWLIGKLG